MPVVTFGLNNTAFAPPPFDIAHVNLRTFVKNCVSNLVQALLLIVLPSLQTVMTLTTLTPQRYTSPITTNISLVTQFFPNLSCCTNPLPRVFERPIATFYAFTTPVVASGKVMETSKSLVPAENRGPFFIATRPIRRHLVPLEPWQLHFNKSRWVSTMHRLCQHAAPVDWKSSPFRTLRNF